MQDHSQRSSSISPRGDSDAVVPVPLSIKGQRTRGFNQSLLVEKIFSDQKGVPLIMDSLLKCRETAAQIGLPAKNRAENLKDAFSALRRFHGMRVLLIDDVMTTDSTSNECTRQLLKAGAEGVSVLALARAWHCSRRQNFQSFPAIRQHSEAVATGLLP